MRGKENSAIDQIQWTMMLARRPETTDTDTMPAMTSLGMM